MFGSHQRCQQKLCTSHSSSVQTNPSTSLFHACTKLKPGLAVELSKLFLTDGVNHARLILVYFLCKPHEICVELERK